MKPLQRLTSSLANDHFRTKVSFLIFKTKQLGKLGKLGWKMLKLTWLLRMLFANTLKFTVLIENVDEKMRFAFMEVFKIKYCEISGHKM